MNSTKDSKVKLKLIYNKKKLNNLSPYTKWIDKKVNIFNWVIL